MFKLKSLFRRDKPTFVPNDPDAPWQSEAGDLLDYLPRSMIVLRPREPYVCPRAPTLPRPSATCWFVGRLTRCRDDGRIEIDNNAAERALRGVGLGRKNYLFMGSDGGGERAAAVYSLVEMAKLNGLDPQVYLRDMLARIADYPINRIDELLPWSVAQAAPERRAA